ncbi:MAG: fibronectin type III domain-containing protein [Acidobacteriota bacterium]|nr:fibronectin type III domain-containing protein [Acidobacteriota bacterium]
MGCHRISRAGLDDQRLSRRNTLRAVLGRMAVIVALNAAMAAAAAAQASPQLPASCATSLTPLDMWDDRIEIATTPDSVDLTWNAPEEGLDYWAYGSERWNTWVVCLPTVPGLADSYVATDRWVRWPLTTVFEERTLPWLELDHEFSVESMTLRGLEPGIDYWVQYWYIRIVFDEKGNPTTERAATNWRHFGLNGPAQRPAPVNVHGAGVWGPRRLASNEITVYWSASLAGGVVESFQVRAKEVAGGDWTEWLDVAGGPKARWHTFGGLTPGRRYTFEVRADNTVGAGPATAVLGAPEPDSRVLEAPCSLNEQLGEPSKAHDEKVQVGRWEEEWSDVDAHSGSVMTFRWVSDGEPTSGSVEYSLCRPEFPGSQRYRSETVTDELTDFSGSRGHRARDDGWTAAAGGLALEAQYWFQAVHLPPSGEAAEAEVTGWIRADEAFNRSWPMWQANAGRLHEAPWVERRIGFESFPGILESFGGLYLLRQPAAPVAVTVSESSPGSVALRWQPSSTGGKVERWEYRASRGSEAWSSWRTMPGELDRLTHVVDGLTPGERYTFEVRGANRDNDGESSADSLQLSSGPPSGCAEAAGPVAEPTAVCLGQGRFRFEVTWESPHDGRTGAGTMRRLTDNTGVATFFDADNVELVFKVLDGTEANGRHWVFYGGLTDLGYTLTVTDTQTGKMKTYRNEPGDLCGEGDTSAFGASNAASSAPGDFRPVGIFSAAGPKRWSEALRAGPGCPTDALCLAGSRFEATVDWTNPVTGLAGRGRPILGTDNTGYMYFFSPDNVELAIKVLDGRAFNDSYWVFATALTDLDYTITVKDTLGGGVKTYGSEGAGQYCTIQDVDAFPQ